MQMQSVMKADHNRA